MNEEIIENPSVLLQLITKAFLPGGFPTIEQMNEMSDEEKSQLYLNQQIIIQQFKNEIMREYQNIQDTIQTQIAIVQCTPTENDYPQKKVKKSLLEYQFPVFLQFFWDYSKPIRVHKKFVLISLLILLFLFLYGYLFSLSYYIY